MTNAAKIRLALTAGPADSANGWMCMPAPEVMCLDKQRHSSRGDQGASMVPTTTMPAGN